MNLSKWSSCVLCKNETATTSVQSDRGFTIARSVQRNQSNSQYFLNGKLLTKHEIHEFCNKRGLNLADERLCILQVFMNFFLQFFWCAYLCLLAKRQHSNSAELSKRATY